jgi:hypothetical protein
MIAPYRVPFDHDPDWDAVGTANWDDPGQVDKHPYYAYDFGFPEGHVIRAARCGTVIDCASDRSGKVPVGGNFVYIRHPDGTIGSYAHLQKDQVFVQKQQWVDQGAVIGFSGSTGASDLPHLHFQVMLYGESETNIGPTIPVLLEDANHAAWRPKGGDSIVSNNTMLRQENWRWCHKCQGLFFAGPDERTPMRGTCPAGSGGHSRDQSGNYVLTLNSAPFNTQPQWRFCSKCRVLFFSGNPGSKCPVDGGAHSGAGSGNYAVHFQSSLMNGQTGWRWCRRCQGLFFSGNTPSACPAGRGGHDATGSGYYELLQTVPPIVQGNWRYCGKCAGLFHAGSRWSVCKGGGMHESGGNIYLLHLDPAPAVMAPNWWLGQGHHTGWRWCSKCHGLFFGGATPSLCPANGPHDSSGSAVYALRTGGTGGQSDWRRCTACQSLFLASAAVSKCPAGGAHVIATRMNYRVEDYW